HADDAGLEGHREMRGPLPDGRALQPVFADEAHLVAVAQQSTEGEPLPDGGEHELDLGDGDKNQRLWRERGAPAGEGAENAEHRRLLRLGAHSQNLGIWW